MPANPLRTFADVLSDPWRGIAAAADARRVAVPLAAATLASLLFAAARLPRSDAARTAADELDRAAEASTQPPQQTTPHQREEAIAQQARVMKILAWGGAAAAPAGSALAVAVCLFVAFRVAASRPGFRATLAVSAWGLLPLQAKALATIPAVLRRAAVTPGEADRLLPTNPAALLPLDLSGPGVRLLSALDLFSLWAIVLVVSGMAHVAGVSRARAAAVVLVLWASWVALSRTALPPRA